MGDPIHQPGRSTAWTRGNLGEAMPGVCKPLSWTFFGPPCEAGIRRGFLRIGAIKRNELPTPSTADERYCTVVFGRGAANIDLMARMAERMPGVDPKEMEVQLFGEVRDVERHPSVRRYLVIAVRMPVEVGTSLRRVRAQRERTAHWWRSALQDMSRGQPSQERAREILREAQDHFAENMALHTTISMIASGAYDAVARLAEQAGVGESASALASGSGRLEEVGVVLDLWEVSRRNLSLETFLERHGFHGTNAGQLHARVWREDPSAIEKLVQTYGQLTEEQSPEARERRQAAARQVAETAVLRFQGRLGRLRARAVIATAARFSAHREVGKAGYLLAIDGARAAARVIGSHLAGTGVITDPEDVFYLTLDEVLGAMPDEIAEVIAERRGQGDAYSRQELPNAWIGTPEVTELSPEAPGSRSGAIEGIGVSSGIVEGVARVVLDPEQADLDADEILVCHMTDPSWVSLFLPAAAVVIDIGGQMSHGAIVARELGIPCVINTRDGTRRINTGDRLRVDGTTGTVEILADQPAT